MFKKWLNPRFEYFSQSQQDKILSWYDEMLNQYSSLDSEK